MESKNIIETERLLLREWQPEDLAPFAAINRDPKVVECLLRPLSEKETAAMIEKIEQCFRQHGFGLFACVLKKTGELLGYVGLNADRYTQV